MKTCTSCGFSNDDAVTFCQQCGSRQSGISPSQSQQTIDLSGVGDKAKSLLKITENKEFPIYAAVVLLLVWLVRQMFAGLDSIQIDYFQYISVDSIYSTQQAWSSFLSSLSGDFGQPFLFIPLDFLLFLLTLYPFALAIYFLIARKNNWLIAGLYPVLTIFVYGALVLSTWIGYGFRLDTIFFYLGLNTLFDSLWTFIAFFVDKMLLLLMVAIAYSDFAVRGPKFKVTK